jgi:hypothetical protein
MDRTIIAMSRLVVWHLDCTLLLRNNAIRAINNHQRVQRTKYLMFNAHAVCFFVGYSWSLL